MRKVTTNTYTRAGTMRDTTFTLIPNALSEVTEPHASANFGDIGSLIQGDTLEGLKVDHYPKALASCLASDPAILTHRSILAA